MFIVFKFHQLKFLSAFYSAITGYFVHIRDFLERRQSITSAMHMCFCSRAPSGFQNELNSRYITCVLSNAHSTLLWVKIGKIVLFSKGTQDSLNYRHWYRYRNKYQKYRDIFLSPYRPFLVYMHNCANKIGVFACRSSRSHERPPGGGDPGQHPPGP